jgi:diguanylate cyclase (GGDEF)-like protein/PAS domain S-box-containing protein
MKLQSKLWLGMGLAYLLLLAGVELASYAAIKRMAEEELRSDAQNIRAILMATRRVYHRQFLASGLPVDDRTLGFLPAHALARIAPELHDWTRSGIRFNNVSDRPRNPANQADARELEAMDWFRKHTQADERLTSYRDASGEEIYHYTAPIRVEAYCLACHGEREAAPATIREHYSQAYDYKVGELRGVLSIRLPAKALMDQVLTYMRQNLLLHLASLLAAFLIGALLLHVLVLRRLGRLRAVSAQLGTGQPVRAEIGGKDEVAALAGTFNAMADAIDAQHRSLREQETQTRLLLECTAEAIVGVDREGRCTFVNPAFLALLGFTSAGQVIGRALHELIHHHRADGSPHSAEDCSILRACRDNQPQHRDDEVFWRQNGEAVAVEFWSRPIERDGQGIGAVVSFIDIGERRQSEQRLRQAAAVYENTLEGVMITDAEARIIAVNPAFSAISGYSEAEALGKSPSILKSGRHDSEFFAAMWQTILATGSWEGEIWNRHKNGQIVPTWLSISSVRDARGEVVNYVSVFSDISRIKQTEAKLEEMAHYDLLTGLPNRLLFQSRLTHALDVAKRWQSHVAVLFFDLDRFKTINDSLGHPIGDELLSAVAHRLFGRLREEDTLARLGGDEFVILLEHIIDPSEAEIVAKDVLRLLADPFQLSSGHEVFISASIGISLYPEDGDDATQLVKNADAAMYEAKEAGRNGYRFYTRMLSRDASDRLLLENHLRRAIERDELVLHYQPQLAIADQRVIGVEALVRWQHPDSGLISPDRFIPIAEECGLIVPLGEWVLREACRQARRWQSMGVPPLIMAVNVSTRQFRQRDLAERVQIILEETGLAPDLLELEITESVMMEEGGRTRDVLQVLKSMGIKVAMDDFGTGYSSLSSLKHFAIDKLKIDRSFIHELEADSSDREITATIIAMARSLKLEVLAEGVENQAQLAFLRLHGCHAFQGYLYSRPLTADECSRLLWRHFKLD